MPAARRTAVVAAVVAAALGAAATVAWQVDGVRAVTVGLPPDLYRSAPPGPPPPGFDRALGVAHNAGNDLAAARSALAAGAEVVEVDVVRVGGRLRAGHDEPVPLLADAVFRGPSLEDVWAVVRPRARVKVDLKQEGRGDVRAVVDALDRWTARDAAEGRPPVVVTSRRPDVVRAVAASPVTRRGDVAAFATLADTAAVRRFLSDADLVRAVSGVSAHHEVLDDATLGRLSAAGLEVLAWTVNDHERAHDLVAAGVDGVTTDDLTLLEQLAGAPGQRVQGHSRTATRSVTSARGTGP